MSDSEWETVSSVDDNYNMKDEVTSHLSESPERVRDLGVQKDYVLSPPVISPRGRNFPAIEDGGFDKEEELLDLDENKMEIANSSLIFQGSKVGKTYPPKEKKKREKGLLTYERKRDWLVDVKVPTATADLLWENYMKDLHAEPPQDQMDDPQVKRNHKDNDTDSDDILAMVSEDRRKLLKSKKLCIIKGGCSKRNGPFPVKVQDLVYMSDNDDEGPSKLDAHKERKGKWIAKQTI